MTGIGQGREMSLRIQVFERIRRAIPPGLRPGDNCRKNRLMIRDCLTFLTITPGR